MATEVIKRDGSRQPFDGEKIKRAIAVSAQEGGLSEERAAELAEQTAAPVLAWAAGRETVQTTDIRDRALAELDSSAPEAAAAWREHDRQQGKA